MRHLRITVVMRQLALLGIFCACVISATKSTEQGLAVQDGLPVMSRKSDDISEVVSSDELDDEGRRPRGLLAALFGYPDESINEGPKLKATSSAIESLASVSSSGMSALKSILDNKKSESMVKAVTTAVPKITSKSSKEKILMMKAAKMLPDDDNATLLEEEPLKNFTTLMMSKGLDPKIAINGTEEGNEDSVSETTIDEESAVQESNSTSDSNATRIEGTSGNKRETKQQFHIQSGPNSLPPLISGGPAGPSGTPFAIDGQPLPAGYIIWHPVAPPFQRGPNDFASASNKDPQAMLPGGDGGLVPHRPFFVAPFQNQFDGPRPFPITQFSSPPLFAVPPPLGEPPRANQEEGNTRGRKKKLPKSKTREKTRPESHDGRPGDFPPPPMHPIHLMLPPLPPAGLPDGGPIFPHQHPPPKFGGPQDQEIGPIRVPPQHSPSQPPPNFQQNQQFHPNFPNFNRQPPVPQQQFQNQQQELQGFPQHQQPNFRPNFDNIPPQQQEQRRPEQHKQRKPTPTPSAHPAKFEIEEQKQMEQDDEERFEQQQQQQNGPPMGRLQLQSQPFPIPLPPPDHFPPPNFHPQQPLFPPPLAQFNSGSQQFLDTSQRDQPFHQHPVKPMPQQSMPFSPSHAPQIQATPSASSATSPSAFQSSSSLSLSPTRNFNELGSRPTSQSLSPIGEDDDKEALMYTRNFKNNKNNNAGESATSQRPFGAMTTQRPFIPSTFPPAPKHFNTPSSFHFGLPSGGPTRFPAIADNNQAFPSHKTMQEKFQEQGFVGQQSQQLPDTHPNLPDFRPESSSTIRPDQTSIQEEPLVTPFPFRDNDYPSPGFHTGHKGFPSSVTASPGISQPVSPDTFSNQIASSSFVTQRPRPRRPRPQTKPESSGSAFDGSFTFHSTFPTHPPFGATIRPNLATSSAPKIMLKPTSSGGSDFSSAVPSEPSFNTQQGVPPTAYKPGTSRILLEMGQWNRDIQRKDVSTQYQDKQDYEYIPQE